MRTAKLEVFERDQKGYKVRQEQFVPGVIYGKEVEAASVKFRKKDVDRLIKESGSRAKLTVILNEKESFGFIKDTARDVLTGDLMHMDIQVVNKDSEISHSVPLVFKGTDALIYNRLILQINANEIQLTGKAKLIPDVIEVDVSNAKSGDTILLTDIDLPDTVTCANMDDIPLAVVTAAKIDEADEKTDDVESNSEGAPAEAMENA
ncbi:50S ribosomal protein L25 [Lutispora sp.]|uniref:50S ribosomal protein L25 n=1 Tax=Lutispora sp. TaxID=2828727 RepID=UPI002B205231|nr:50S ribosomal protein L25 [Lutispora sp.]MEA4963386.1 50S ribosomal protein L25 [Lutispora sp.]